MDRYKKYNISTDAYEHINYEDIEKGDRLLIYTSFQHELMEWMKLICVSVGKDSKGEKMFRYSYDKIEEEN